MIGNSPAERLKSMRRLPGPAASAPSIPCGMLRRIVLTTAYHRYIADCDEDQARAWLRELEPQPAPNLLALVTPQAAADSGSADVQIYRILALGLMSNGYDATGQGTFDVVRRTDKRNVLRGWTRERWEGPKPRRWAGSPAQDMS